MCPGFKLGERLPVKGKGLGEGRTSGGRCFMVIVRVSEDGFKWKRVDG